MAALVLLLPPETHPAVTPAALALLMACAIAGAVSAKVPGAPYLAAFVGVAAVSIGWSSRPGPAVEALVGFVLAGGLYLTLAGGGARGPAFGPAASVLASVHGAHAVWQRTVSLPSLAASLAGATGEAEQLFWFRAASGRALSTFALPAHLSALLAALVPLLVEEVWGGRARWRRILGVLGLAGAGAGMWATGALGGPMALAVAAAVQLLARSRARKLRFALIGAAVVALAVVARSRALDLAHWSSQANPVSTRLRLWEHAVQVLGESPMTGAGLGSYPVAWLRFARPGDVPAQNAHQSYLEIAAEIGLPGLALFLLFAGAALRAAPESPAQLGALVLLLHAAVDFDLQSPGLRLATFALLGAAVGRRETLPSLPRGRRVLVAVFAASALIATAREAGRLTMLLPGAPPRSDADLDRAVTRWPLDAAARGERASRLLSRGQPEAAFAECRRALALEPRTPWLMALEGEIEIARGRAFAAFFAYREASRRYPAQDAYARRAEAIAARIASANAEVRKEVP